MVAGVLDEGRIGGFERQHAMLCQIYRILEFGAKDKWPRSGVGLAAARLVRPRRPTRRPFGHPPKLQQLSLGTGKQPHWSQQRNS